MVGLPVQLSTAVTPVVEGAAMFEAQVTVTFDGQLIVGTMLSLTVIT